MLALAACGSSGSTASNTTKGPAATSPPDTSSATTSAPSGTAVVMTADNAKLGTVLVDSTGKTLYTLTNGGKAVACTGQCPTFWPPLLLPSGATSATGAAGVTGLATTAANGGMQVTENGLPLYRFSGDTKAGDANGEGIASFGGTWHTVKASGGAASTNTTAAPASDAPTTTSGYGY